MRSFFENCRFLTVSLHFCNHWRRHCCLFSCHQFSILFFLLSSPIFTSNHRHHFSQLAMNENCWRKISVSCVVVLSIKWICREHECQRISIKNKWKFCDAFKLFPSFLHFFFNSKLFVTKFIFLQNFIQFFISTSREAGRGLSLSGLMSHWLICFMLSCLLLWFFENFFYILLVYVW